MPKINPDILRWARETAGLDLSDAAQKIGLKDARGISGSERLARLEAGKGEPTRSQLQKMSAHYRRPLLTFYLAEPPAKADRGQDFRTVTPWLKRRDHPMVDALLRDIRARQNLVRGLLEVGDEAENLPFVGSFDRALGAAVLSDNIREALGFDLASFRRGSPKGFAYLRDLVERVGVFVLLTGNLGSHHSALDVDLFRGFASADPVAPFIVINDQDSDRAWSFTLMHELSHIWLGQTGVSGTQCESDIEIFCNDVSGRILLPKEDLVREWDLTSSHQGEVVTRISRVADNLQVSQSMVAYKLYREGLISHALWASLTAAFREQWLRSRAARRQQTSDGNRGPDYFIVKRHRLGKKLLDLAKRMLAEGNVSPSKAATILGVKPSKVYFLTGA